MLEQQISKQIMEAMKAKDTVRLSALRNIKKYIIEAKTSGTAVDTLPDADVVKIISKLAKQGSDSAAIYTQQNRPDLAGEELAQVRVMQEFLPRQMNGRGARRCRSRDHRRGGCRVDEGYGQGHGRRLEAARRSGRRQRYIGQGKGAAGITRTHAIAA